MNQVLTEDKNQSGSISSREHSKETNSTNTLYLIGLPNAGKSTLFNMLTGGNRKISNYSGITVDASIGQLTSNSHHDTNYRILDLPGIFHLNPSSFDEGITVATLLGLNPQYKEGKAVIVLDWQRMESSLALALGVLDLLRDLARRENIEAPIAVINKDDNKEVDQYMRQSLEEFLGIRVLPMSALDSQIEVLDHFIREYNWNEGEKPALTDQRAKDNCSFYITSQGASYLPLSLAETRKGLERPFSLASDEELVTNQINHNLEKSRQFIKDGMTLSKKGAEATDKLDKIVLHPLLGGIIFFAIFYLIFHGLYTWSAPLMELSEGLVVGLGELVGNMLPDGLFKSLIVDGIFGGVGGVVVFLPQIMILFFLLSLLEQSGYISRAALISDRLMSFFGLGGKAFLPYMSGFACAIPGIMATRTISNQKERLATILTLPLITCSARLPVYVLLIGTFVPEKKVLGFFDSRALSFFFLYFLGSIMALIMAKVFRLSLFKGKSSSFLIDLPHYQRPSLRMAWSSCWNKGRAFLKKAGTIILALSLGIWVLSTFPQMPEESISSGQEMSEEVMAAKQLEYSALGRLGKGIEPLIQPLGMNWKMGIGLLVSFGARELFVSALGTIYALGEVDEENEGLRDRLRAEINPDTGRPVFDLATAWSILIFFVFSLQCTSTLAILRKETESWKLTTFSFFYMLALAYGGSFIAYHLLSA